MINIKMAFRSKQLKRDVNLNLLLPEKTDCCKTLWLLHGLSGNQDSWMRYTSIERYASEYGIAVVMPCADRSWYSDTVYEENYFTFISEELPTVLRKQFRILSDKPQDNIVAGLSMGGYGALKLCLTHPERYGGCISLSGSLDIMRKGRELDLNKWRSIFNFNMESAFELEGGKHDLFALAKDNKSKALPFPPIYMWCGTEDILIKTNTEFHTLLDSLGVPHTFETSEGDHSWKWWDMHIQDGLAKIFG
jgi:S-formylglutathione hydrolase FrmB